LDKWGVAFRGRGFKKKPSKNDSPIGKWPEMRQRFHTDRETENRKEAGWDAHDDRADCGILEDIVVTRTDRESLDKET